jgi:hypothetical protein
VPVHRSRIRSFCLSARAFCLTNPANWTVYPSVSDLGIKTPLSHRISRSPKGCVPRMYWRGSPLALRRTSFRKVVLHPSAEDILVRDLRRVRFGGDDCRAMACSINHLSSFWADRVSLHSRNRIGRSGCLRLAWWSREGATRGI